MVFGGALRDLYGHLLRISPAFLFCMHACAHGLLCIVAISEGIYSNAIALDVDLYLPLWPTGMSLASSKVTDMQVFLHVNAECCPCKSARCIRRCHFTVYIYIFFLFTNK